MACPSIITRIPKAGHAAGANLKQAAHTNALEMVYLTRKLMDDDAARVDDNRALSELTIH